MSSREIGGLWLSAAALAGLVAYLFLPVLSCPTSCFVDPIAVSGPGLGHIQLPDLQLNAWILAWVQRALLGDPFALFDGNVFYPTPAALTQSEHMLSVAVWTLPLRLFSSSAVWLHQAAVIGSSFLLALTTSALVRWLTASTLAGFAAGLAAIWMPWRFTELAHVQLVNAQWFPLVWLYLGRLVEDPTQRRAAIGLGVALLLQLLSSFYLAYFLLLSCAGLLLGLWLVQKPSAAAWKRIGLAAAGPGAALVAIALPYLRWSRERGFQAVDPLFDSVPPLDVLALTLPGVPSALRSLPVETSYAIPLGVALLALVSLYALRSDQASKRRRGFVLGLCFACAAALVLALGRRLELGDVSLPLPGSLAAILVPGFENLRNPLRFTIVIGLAAPVLAGIGFAKLLSFAPGRIARAALATGTLSLLGFDLVTPPLPAIDAWQGNTGRLAAYRELALLPRGPLVEMPWSLQPEHDAIHAARAMLGSTLHWQPLVNGHSGYVPPSYPLLRQRAQGLPSAEALVRLQELVDVRWILVPASELSQETRQSWHEAVRKGRLRSAFADPGASLFEVVDWQRGGRFAQALTEPARGAESLAGHSRAPLSSADGAGRLELELDTANTFYFAGRRRLPRLVTLRVENRGTRTWPGLDPDPEGLVRLRFTFLAPNGTLVLQETSALAADVPPGRVRLEVPVSPPARAGRHRLRLELVQREAGEDRLLPVEPVESDVSVRAAL